MRPVRSQSVCEKIRKDEPLVSLASCVITLHTPIPKIPPTYCFEIADPIYMCFLFSPLLLLASYTSHTVQGIHITPSFPLLPSRHTNGVGAFKRRTPARAAVGDESKAPLTRHEYIIVDTSVDNNDETHLK